MTLPLLKPRPLTLDEFREIALNAPDDERWELIGGRIVRSMAGGTLRHNKLVLNVATILRGRLAERGSPCETFTENVRLDPPGAGISTLPDVVVTCDPPPDDQTVIFDATAIVEVLSPSTVATDLNEKLSAYLNLPALRTCAFVEQSEMKVVVFTPSPAGWLRREFTAADDVLAFDSLNVSMTLGEVYRRVEIETQTAPTGNRL